MSGPAGAAADAEGGRSHGSGNYGGGNYGGGNYGGGNHGGENHGIEVAAAPPAALAAVGEAAEHWGADWQAAGASAGTLALPFTAGLRRGWLRARVDVTAGTAAGASRLTLTVEERHDEVQWGAVAILLIAAGGGLLAAAWPFVPELLPVAPFGVLLAIGGWLLVVSRLRSAGIHEFLDLAREEAERGAGGGGADVGAANVGDSRPE